MNEHIETYCTSFIDNENNPEFALFLKGQWGCGKTFFIKNLVKKHYKTRENEFTFVSLFGVKEISELDMKVFQSIYPKVGMIMDIGLKVGLSKIGLDSKDSLKDKIIRPFKRKSVDKKVIIIDDLERSELLYSQIFGYFSELIINYGTKIIFVGNEEKIVKEEYKEIKEKTIGIEFLIKPDYENALKYFIDNLKINISEKNLRDIKNIIEMLECKNLRLVRQCFYNLSLFLQNIEKTLNPEHLEIIVRIFVALFMQKCSNIINEKEQIENAITAYNYHKLDYKTYETKCNKNNGPDFTNDYDAYIPFLRCWKDVIFDGNYSSEFILAEYNKEKQEIRDKNNIKTLFYLMGNWLNMNSDEFKENIKKVVNEFSNGNYLHIGEILHYYNFISRLFKEGLIEYNIDKLNKDIDNLIKNYSEKIKDFEDLNMYSYGGFSFSNRPEDIIQKLRNITIIHETEFAKQEFIKEIQDLPNNFWGFIKNISGFYIKTNKNITYKYDSIKFYLKAILSFIDIQILFDKMQSLSLNEQDHIIYSLKERYGMCWQSSRVSNGKVDEKYFPEIENLEKLYKLYEESQSDIFYNPAEYQKKELVLQLKELVEYFKDSMEQQKGIT
jgi:hypothetical protein